MKRLIIGVIVLLGLAARPSAQLVTWRMDVSQAGYNNGKRMGFGFYSGGTLENVKNTIAFEPTGGPGGTPAVALTFLPNTSGSGGAMTWSGTTNPGPTQGGSLVVRIWIYFSRVQDIRSPGNGVWGSKTMIVTANPDGYRAIETMVPHTASMILQQRYGQNINGPPHETTQDPSPRVGWNAFQTTVRTSTTPTSGNGCYYVHINNDNQSAPNGQSACVTSLLASAMGGIEIGGWDRIGTGQSLVIKVAAVEVGTTFDSTWSARLQALLSGQTIPTPGAPGRPIFTTP